MYSSHIIVAHKLQASAIRPDPLTQKNTVRRLSQHENRDTSNIIIELYILVSRPCIIDGYRKN